jgi:predicted TIM-barrel fold metal-dependent hydrolase
VERVRGVANLARQISTQRVIFGSHFPLFYVESAIFKMRESGLSVVDFSAISEGNARRLAAAK